MIDLGKLANFLVKAKKATYASSDRMNINAERPLHAELEFSEGDFYYRDSYVGFFQAPGMEEVRLEKNGKTIWTMAYSGGMLKKYQGDKKFAESIFAFLKKALNLVREDIPFRGPEKLEEGDLKYVNKIEGDITRFRGHEKILFKGEEVFNERGLRYVAKTVDTILANSFENRRLARATSFIFDCVGIWSRSDIFTGRSRKLYSIPRAGNYCYDHSFYGNVFRNGSHMG
jgi:hypothetical protein